MRMRKIMLGVALLCFSANLWAGINDGLVAYFPFSGNANDESGNGYLAVVYGPTLTADRFGNADSAYFFDNGFIETNVNGNQFTNSMSYSLWLKTDENNADYIISNEKDSFYIYHSVNYLRRSNEYEVFNVDLTNNTWHHLAVTYTDKSATVYINGLKFNQVSFSESFTFGDHFRFGKRDAADSPDFTGILDDIRIYNRVLTDGEVYELYSGNPAGPAGSIKLTNISARANIGGGAYDIFGGFAVSGSGTQRVLVRGIAVDPGVDPVIQVLHQSTGAVIASNDEWEQASNAAEISALPAYLHLPDTNGNDAGLLLSLSAGVYAVVLSTNGAHGLALIGVDAVD